jgi:hypothetical protein
MGCVRTSPLTQIDLRIEPQPTLALGHSVGYKRSDDMDEKIAADVAYDAWHSGWRKV